MAEVAIRVTDSVEGYRVGSTVLPYRELQKTNRNMRRRSRELKTQGHDTDEAQWFGDGIPPQGRHSVMEALKASTRARASLAPLSFAGRMSYRTCGRVCSLVNEDIVIFDD